MCSAKSLMILLPLRDFKADADYTIYICCKIYVTTANLDFRIFFAI